MQEANQQSEYAGAGSAKRLSDGLHRFRKGLKSLWVYVHDGILWLSIDVLPPIIWMDAGKPVTIVNKRGFMRARDIIEEMPRTKSTIEAIAANHGLAV